MADLKHTLWQAFHAGGIWSLDAMEKKNDQSPKAAFDIWYANTDPLMAHREVGVVERDHRAMEALRLASLRRGWQWHWDELYELKQIPVEPQRKTYKDPADAILGTDEPDGE